MANGVSMASVVAGGAETETPSGFGLPVEKIRKCV
jgi:hypothetical protein